MSGRAIPVSTRSTVDATSREAIEEAGRGAVHDRKGAAHNTSGFAIQVLAAECRLRGMQSPKGWKARRESFDISTVVSVVFANFVHSSRFDARHLRQEPFSLHSSRVYVLSSEKTSYIIIFCSTQSQKSRRYTIIG